MSLQNTEQVLAAARYPTSGTAFPEACTKSPGLAITKFVRKSHRHLVSLVSRKLHWFGDVFGGGPPR